MMYEWVISDGEKYYAGNNRWTKTLKKAQLQCKYNGIVELCETYGYKMLKVKTIKTIVLI